MKGSYEKEGRTTTYLQRETLSLCCRCGSDRLPRTMEFTPLTVFGLILLGAVAGTLAGLLGIGGGVINVPALTLVFGLGNILLVKAIVFTTMIFTVLSSATRHIQSRLVLRRVVKFLVPMGGAGVAAGYLLSRDMPPSLFQGLFGIFLLYVVALNVKRIFMAGGERDLATGDGDAVPYRRAFWIGAPMGFVAGVLGIGGGSLAGPGLQVFVRLPLRNAIACSSVSMIPLVAVAVGLSLWEGCQGGFGAPWWTAPAAAAFMIPGAVTGAWLGAWLTKVLPVRGVRAVFVAVLLVTAAKLIHAALSA